MLSETHLSEVGNFNPEVIGQLRPALSGGVDAVSAAGALDLGKYVTELTVSGTKAYTLAAPTVAGLRKRIVCVSAASTPLGTVTISSPDDTAGFVCATTFTFDTVGQAIELLATSALKWRCVRVQRAGTSGNNGVVIGTTVLTGLSLWAVYLCSVTGTVSSTTTKALPNGSAVGEMITVSCTTAALSPSGTLGGSYVDLTATARTGMVLDATTDTAVFTWNGSAWQAQYNTATYS
jgi:hypothetical protein